jgi:hypothetical protein
MKNRAGAGVTARSRVANTHPKSGRKVSGNKTACQNVKYLAADPVAADYTGWQIIERKRAEAGLRSLENSGSPPLYIDVAAVPQHRLGTSDPQRIALPEV